LDGVAMALAARSRPPAVTAAPAADEKRAATATALPVAILRMQRGAGNAAVARAVAPRAIQRCGSGCGCASCGHSAEDELLDEQRGAGLLRSAVQRRSA
jgi:hypothetical protein